MDGHQPQQQGQKSPATHKPFKGQRSKGQARRHPYCPGHQGHRDSRSLTRMERREVKRRTPAWTGGNDHLISSPAPAPNAFEYLSMMTFLFTINGDYMRSEGPLRDTSLSLCPLLAQRTREYNLVFLDLNGASIITMGEVRLSFLAPPHAHRSSYGAPLCRSCCCCSSLSSGRKSSCQCSASRSRGSTSTRPPRLVTACSIHGNRDRQGEEAGP